MLPAKPLPMHPAQKEVYQQWLEILRAECKEIGISGGYQKIADYLNGLGGVVKTGRGRPISVNTVRLWHYTRGFPVFVNNRKDGASTTTTLIQAWLASYHLWSKHAKKKYRKQPLARPNPAW